MLTFNQVFMGVVPGSPYPRSGRALCSAMKCRGLAFRAVATAMGARQCAITVKLYSPSVLKSNNLTAALQSPQSRMNIGELQALNAQLVPHGLSLKLVSKDLSEAVLVGTWDSLAGFDVGVLNPARYVGPNTEEQLGTGVMAVGGVVLAIVGATAVVPTAIGVVIVLGGIVLAVDGGMRLDDQTPAPTTPTAPPQTTKSNTDDTINQDDDESAPGDQDPASIPNCILFGIVPDGTDPDQVLLALAGDLGLPDTTGWGGSDPGGFLTGGVGDGDPSSGDGIFGSGDSGVLAHKPVRTGPVKSVPIGPGSIRRTLS